MSRQSSNAIARMLDVVTLNARVMLASGHHGGAVVLMRYAMREAGEDIRLLRLLAHALDALGRHGEALNTLARLEAFAGSQSSGDATGDAGDGSPVDLMAARALLALGRTEEARERFARHVAALGDGARSRTEAPTPERAVADPVDAATERAA